VVLHYSLLRLEDRGILDSEHSQNRWIIRDLVQVEVDLVSNSLMAIVCLEGTPPQAVEEHSPMSSHRTVLMEVKTVAAGALTGVGNCGETGTREVGTETEILEEILTGEIARISGEVVIGVDRVVVTRMVGDLESKVVGIAVGETTQEMAEMVEMGHVEVEEAVVVEMTVMVADLIVAGVIVMLVEAVTSREIVTWVEIREGTVNATQVATVGIVNVIVEDETVTEVNQSVAGSQKGDVRLTVAPDLNRRTKVGGEPKS
jgi:hypothetical protein